MKPSYGNFEPRNNRSGIGLPPVGQYVAEIQGVRLETNPVSGRDMIVLMLEITEGEYANRYHEVFQSQRERFGDSVKYRGTFRLTAPKEEDESWMRQRFESNLWCVEQSNPGYHWDWDETKLKGKKVGINVRENVYTGNDGTEKTTTEIGQLEPIDDVRNGKCRDMKPRKQNNTASATSTGGYTEVDPGKVEVPF